MILFPLLKFVEFGGGILLTLIFVGFALRARSQYGDHDQEHLRQRNRSLEADNKSLRQQIARLESDAKRRD